MSYAEKAWVLETGDSVLYSQLLFSLVYVTKYILSRKHCNMYM